ncbi:MAG TPA: endo alpha-1,4 polygalactosaminidase [Polyangia bacterium]|nr:endo alpha-1,4 polygalactosaminidase [Polyangia bacterium]
MRAPLQVAALLGATIVASCGETRGTLVTTDAAVDAGTPWRPTASTTWQIQLTGALDPSIDVALYELDSFETTASQMATLRAAGRRIVCYVSAGTFEPWRDDAAAFPPAAIGNALANYPDERWLDFRDGVVRDVMTARLQVAKQVGCDGVDLSSLSPGGADTGFDLQRSDVLAYGRFLAAQAHQRGLSAGLGGGSDVADALQPDFDWVTTGGCVASDTCGAFAAFTAAGKAVLGIEFGTADDVAAICPQARQAGVNVIIKNRSLDAFRLPCP